jgi:hypothetical protein
MRACLTITTQNRIMNHLRTDHTKALLKIAHLESTITDLQSRRIRIRQITSGLSSSSPMTQAFDAELIRNMEIISHSHR